MDPSNVKSGSVAIAPFPPEPYNILYWPKLVWPVPPFATAKVPDDILEAFKAVKAVPVPLWIPEILVAVKVLVAVAHVNPALCVIAVVPPINNLSTVKAVTPVPPWAIASVPDDILEVHFLIIFYRL